MDAIRERDAAWSPRCQHNVKYLCEQTEADHPSIRALHTFRYDPAADTSPEADRRRLLPVLEAARAYIEWRDKRLAQWEAVASEDDHGPAWEALVNEPFDVDQRLDDALRAALAALEGGAS